MSQGIVNIIANDSRRWRQVDEDSYRRTAARLAECAPDADVLPDQFDAYYAGELVRGARGAPADLLARFPGEPGIRAALADYL